MERAAARRKRRSALPAAFSAIGILAVWVGANFGVAMAADATTPDSSTKTPAKTPKKSVPSTRLAAPGGATSEDEGIPAFKPPPVSDPMLTPPPEAQKQVATWEDALDLLRTHSPDYLANYQKIIVAEAKTRIALATVLPMLNAQGAYTHQFNSANISIAGLTLVTPPPDTLTASGNATWDILDAHAIYGVKTAEKNTDATKLEFEERRRVIATTAVNAMLQTLANERVAELNRVGLRTALERLVLTQTRYQFGQGTQLDIDRALQDVANARSTIISGDESLRQAREALGVALGSPVPISAPGNLDLEGFEAGVARTCKLNSDIERRPDIVAARAREDIAHRAITAAELEFVPTVAVSSQLAHSNVAVLGPLTTFDVGGVLTIPLFDGGARYGRLREARAEDEQAKQNLESTRLNAIVASAQAERNVGVSKSERDVAQQQRDLAARVDARVRDGYSQGIGTSLDLVTSAQALRQADINLAVLDFQVAEARANAVLANAECVY